MAFTGFGCLGLLGLFVLCATIGALGPSPDHGGNLPAPAAPFSQPVAGTAKVAAQPAKQPPHPTAGYGGLGISRADAEAIYSGEDFGISFEESPLNDGRPRVLGQAGVLIVELIGDPDNLTEISLAAGIPNDDPATALKSIGNVVAVAHEHAPHAVKWVISQLDRMSKTTGNLDRRRRFGDRTVHFQTLKELGLITVTVKAR